MSNIPEARLRLQHMINASKDGYPYSPEQLVKHLESILPLLMRREHVHRSVRQSQKITPELVNAIRSFAQRNADMSLQSIAVKFNVNSARVSEILSGDR